MLEKKKGVKCVFLFKNHGPKGGASIDHEHAQITALPFVPPLLQAEADAQKKSKRCMFCQLAREEKYVLARNRFFTAVCPPYARFPYEVWIIPHTHHRDFLGFTGEEDREFMHMLSLVLKRVTHVSPDYNIAFHQSWPGASLHFHIEIYPRSPSTWAGFELGTGVIVNSHDEKDALASLKS